MAAVLNSDRLEVSVDGLTLSPNAEVPACEARPAQGEPAAGRGRAGPGSPGSAEAGGEAAEEAALSLERRWGFALEELYGLALRFFKGEPGPHRLPPQPGLPPAPGSPGRHRPLGRAAGLRRSSGSPESRGRPQEGSVCRGEQRDVGCAFPGTGRGPGRGAGAAVWQCPGWAAGATELRATGSGKESSMGARSLAQSRAAPADSRVWRELPGPLLSLQLQGRLCCFRARGHSREAVLGEA